MCQFDAKLLLRHQKLHLDWQLKLVDLRQLMFYQELLLLKEVDRREEILQEKLNARMKEENSITVGGILCSCGWSFRFILYLRNLFKGPYPIFNCILCNIADHIILEFALIFLPLRQPFISIHLPVCYILPSLFLFLDSLSWRSVMNSWN